MDACLCHEPSSPARKLGSWARIPLEAWVFAYVYSVCVGSGLAKGWPPSKESCRLCIGLRNWSETKRFTDALCSEVAATGKKEWEIVPSNYRPTHQLVAMQGKTDCLNIYRECLCLSTCSRAAQPRNNPGYILDTIFVFFFFLIWCRPHWPLNLTWNERVIIASSKPT
jgi:hypothetical protein